MNRLTTTRLHLTPLSLRQLHSWVFHAARSEVVGEWRLSPGLVTPVVLKALRTKARKMTHTAVSNHPWYTYWLIHPHSQPLGIGLLGFKGEPDRYGEVEIGYGIAPEYGRQGYTTEAVQALVTWALGHPTCRAVRAVTLKENLASQRVLQKVGMHLEQDRPTTLVWRLTRHTLPQLD